jgi:UDPglucose--hexose-1-phosphate uridylyltransferase
MNFEAPHRRFNPLTREWLLVSPHRARRPWLGQVEEVPPEHQAPFDPACYLCPGNERAAGKRNPAYTGTFVFDNDFPALLSPEQTLPGREFAGVEAASPVPSLTGVESSSLFAAEPEFGICRVVCFSPRHDLSLPELSQPEVEAVVQTWVDQTVSLGQLDFTAYIQIFENKGAMMGASNPHPHCQVWASSHIPNEPAKEIVSQEAYRGKHGSCLLCDYLTMEKVRGERLVTANEHFTALVPFWAVWPFEILLVSNRHVNDLPSLEGDEIAGLADLLRKVTARYDNLFEISFPYSMGFHQAPVSGHDFRDVHLHAHYYPPLLRSATVRKFMVGYEMLAMPQRDLTPESAAGRLRSLSEQHYRAEQGS